MSDNTNFEKENHTSGLIYFMPEWIFSHPELSQSEKMIYALLSGLAHGNEHKTCYPSDNWIANRMKMRRQNVNACISNLVRVGAISKITTSHEKNPMRRIRIITVYLYPQNIFTMSEKPDTRMSENSDTGESEKPDIENIKDIKHKGSENLTSSSSSSLHAKYKTHKVESEKKPRKPSQAKAAPSAKASELAEFFLSKIKEKKKDFKIPNLKKWAEEFDLMLRKDGRDPEKIKEVLEWIGSGRAHYTYIQSPKKLRDKFDEQEMRMESDSVYRRITQNRLYASHIQKQYPKQYADLTWDAERAINIKFGKAIYFNQPEDEFRNALHKLFGVRL